MPPLAVLLYPPDLLKIGSEKQGGVPDPKNVNAIAATLQRNASAGQRSGTVLLRGFIYGSEFNYKRKNRIAIPAHFFRPFDGQYLSNVHILGKYSPLDFETAEPINPLDGVMQQTGYGPEVAVGKTFPMSWVPNWVEWLNFDNVGICGLGACCFYVFTSALRSSCSIHSLRHPTARARA